MKKVYITPHMFPAGSEPDKIYEDKNGTYFFTNVNCIWCGRKREDMAFITRRCDTPVLVDEVGKHNLPFWICESCIA